MSLSHEHVGSKIPAKINTFMLTRAELLIYLCYEIPCNIKMAPNTADSKIYRHCCIFKKLEQKIYMGPLNHTIIEYQAVLCRLHTRLNSVSVRLVTQRNESQTKAVEQVNQKLDDLVAMIEFGSDDAPKIAESYLNACSNGIGSKFEALLLSCTSDDQKAAKARIKTIIDNMNAIKDGDDNDKKEQSTENSNM